MKKRETSIRMYSLNLRCGAMADKRDGEENRPCYRLFRVKKQIEQYDPDVIAFQEYTTGWAGMLPDALPQYTIVNKWRASAMDQRKTHDLESAPVAYKTAKYNELDRGWFWLSETPEKSSPPYEKGEPRIVIWVHLEDKETGGRFYFCSTHLPLTRYSITNCGRQCARWFDALPAGTHAFMLGDYNCCYQDYCYSSFAYQPGFKNLMDTAKAMAAEGRCQLGEIRKGTFNGFKWEDGNGLIDFIFVKPNPHIAVDRFEILYDSKVGVPEMEIEPGFVSDHFALYAEVRIDTAEDNSRYLANGPDAKRSHPRDRILSLEEWEAMVADE